LVLVFWLDACPCILSYLRAAEVCSAEETELPVWKRPPVSVANGLATPLGLDPGSRMRLPGMTRYIAWWTCFGGTFPPFHLSTFLPSKILSILLSAFYNLFHLFTKYEVNANNIALHSQKTTAIFFIFLHSALPCCYWLWCHHP
jgi:hypothetical protein